MGESGCGLFWLESRACVGKGKGGGGSRKGIDWVEGGGYARAFEGGVSCGERAQYTANEARTKEAWGARTFACW